MNRKKVFIVISLLIALLDGVFVVANYILSRHAMHEDLLKESATLFNAFQAAVEDTENNLLLIASVFANDERAQALFLDGGKAVAAEGGGAGDEKAARARQALYDYIAPRWEHAMQKLGARQLHFHLGPGSVSFLRVHRPEKFGDRMDKVRFTIVDTNKERSSRSGFETGRVYSGIRGVAPMSAIDPVTGRYTHVGALEAGISFNTLVTNFEKHTHTSTSVLLSREHIESAMWPDFIAAKFTGRQLPGDFFIEASSRPINLALFNSALLASAPNSADATQPHIVYDSGRYWYAARFPLRDYLGRKIPSRADVGVIVLWKDISTRVQIFHNTQWFNLIYALLAFFAIELVLYLGFRQVTGFLEQQVESRTASLNASRNRLRTLINATPDLIYFKDGEGRWLEANEASLDLFRLRDHEYRGKNNKQLAELVHPAFHDRFQFADAGDEVAWEERALCRSEETLYPQDGTARTFDFIKVPIFDPMGERQGLVVLGRDISESIRARQALENSEARYRRFFTDNKAPMLLLDPDDGWIVAANQAASRFYGYSVVELQQLNLKDISMQTDAELATEKTLAREQKRDYLLCRHMMKNGEIRDMEMHSGSMELDERRLTYCIAHDITDRRRITEALQASETKYRQLFDSSPEGIWLLDQDRLTTEVNPQLRRLLGYRAEDMTGKRPTAFMDSDNQRIFQQREGSMADTDLGAYEIALLHKDGSKIRTLFRTLNLRDQDGDISATLVFVTIPAAHGDSV